MSTPIHLLEQVAGPAPGTSACAGKLGSNSPRLQLRRLWLPPPFDGVGEAFDDGMQE